MANTSRVSGVVTMDRELSPQSQRRGVPRAHQARWSGWRSVGSPRQSCAQSRTHVHTLPSLLEWPSGWGHRAHPTASRSSNPSSPPACLRGIAQGGTH
jgi:hypothetical protein